MTQLKVLMVSKFRRFQGGVERHIEDLSQGLLDRGYLVDHFGSEDILTAGGQVFDRQASTFSSKLISAGNLLWNVTARKLLKEKVAQFEPDLIHFHSIYHQLSPSVLTDFEIPTVMTLHDYKLAAPCYTLYRAGEICSECVGKRLPLPSLQYGCVGGSTIEGSLCVIEQLLHRSKYSSKIDRFIVPSDFSRRIMIDAGLKEDKVVTVPWGVETKASRAATTTRNGLPAVAYVGRLHPSKGILPVLDAWQASRLGEHSRLIIAGGGELEPEVTAARNHDSTIEYRGLVPPSEASRIIAESDILLMPSLAPETMGLTAVEALILGTPILSSGRGALGDLSGPGVIDLNEPSAEEIGKTLREVLLSPGVLNQHRSELRNRDLSLYTRESMVGRILAEYQHAGLKII